MNKRYPVKKREERAVKMVFWFIIILLLLPFLLLRQYRRKPRQLPPGPPSWPVVGHLFDLGPMPHHTVAKFGEKYGPVIWLKLGSINTVAINSTKAAMDLFKNHDATFSDRAIRNLMRAQDYHNSSVAIAPTGPYWRTLRRISAMEMLTVKRINETVGVRRRCVDGLMNWIVTEIETGRARNGVHLARFVFLTSFNLLGNLMVSRDLVDPDSSVGSEFYGAMTGLMEWTGHPNMADVFPVLGWLDLQGLWRNMNRDLKKAMEIAGEFVKERVEERRRRQLQQAVAGDDDVIDGKKDFLDVLLDFEGKGKDEPSKLTQHNVVTYILEIFLAGSESTSSTIEWAFTELLCSPGDSMSKAKTELFKVLGDRKMEEADIDSLPYLQAVVKETLRLHPPIPFLVPRRAIEDTTFMGYDIPKGTQMFVNAWAIGRDPESWENPNVFQPERFLGSDIDYKGQHYEMIPFGAGRRMCAGVPLAHRMLHLVLGTLLHEFDWELCNGVTSANIDWKERMGVTVRKMEPLLLIPKKCNVV
ncbi:cytochrome P450 76A1-like [Impatiens glandulifera]|uniref:cytochrome P450 76A1-like n=1 Tax=Impatiens glandulifera TaxID=253017 RepID=UPI001FB100E8|nr:cytochrome P450 76A1-like [Impatiens glandulifera]